ncbi:uncharacterized protein PHACADRAFT_210348 [Phanerochaete carnosa HHB-10118-sp]|uniref:Uncharacterized protein n=1 Tax=Phanerochaete carnosa (strain HHB-10118-sp) TaxID=650164 RepID=K5W5V7_PHACS|nr:uncharacterized protein PHACADRAFT_210348 [Phanerochaete carnosa HHB-10118-sp]EKM54550.1 hypothetical protein PHACADRAFT_210348 [Phanerochaete carnosa HHB-10118-sp]
MPVLFITCQLSTLFRVIIDNTALLQYKTELALTGNLDGPDTHISVATRLQRLRSSQNAWKTFGWTKETFGPVLKESCAHISGSILAQMGSDCTMICSQLPSLSRNIPYKERKLASGRFGFEVIEYALDQGQDLLVLVEETADEEQYFFNLHLRSLESNVLHPLGSSVKMSAPLGTRELQEDCCLDMMISDDYIGMMIYEETLLRFTELWIWNWKTGDVKLNVHGNLEHGYSSHSFMFIGTGQLLVPIITTADDFDPDAEVKGVLPVFDCATTRSRPCTYEHALKHYATTVFHLPATRRGVECARLDLFGTPYASLPRGAHRKLDVPYYASPEDQLLAFRLWMLKSTDEWKHYTLFVSSRTLRDVARTTRLGASRSERTVVVEWDAWASMSRMVPEIRTMHHAHLSQMRCIIAEPAPSRSHGRKQDVLCLYEFASPLLLRKELSNPVCPGSVAGVADLPFYGLGSSEINHLDVWTKPIKTALPFRKTVSNLEVSQQDGYQINEDCIILRSVRPKYVVHLRGMYAAYYRSKAVKAASPRVRMVELSYPAFLKNYGEKPILDVPAFPYDLQRMGRLYEQGDDKLQRTVRMATK